MNAEKESTEEKNKIEWNLYGNSKSVDWWMDNKLSDIQVFSMKIDLYLDCSLAYKRALQYELFSG